MLPMTTGSLANCYSNVLGKMTGDKIRRFLINGTLQSVKVLFGLVPYFYFNKMTTLQKPYPFPPSCKKKQKP